MSISWASHKILSYISPSKHITYCSALPLQNKFLTRANMNTHNNKQTPGLQSTSKLYRPSNHRLSAKLVPTLADSGCRVVSATNPPVVNFGFLDRSRYFLETVPQLSSWGWVDPVPDSLLLRKNLVAAGIEPGPLNL
jgi:hypothetical protein